jgi:regulation of enolase protein 1 (concanavalin A-like superfamily)
MKHLQIPNLSQPLEWHNQPASWDWSNEKLTISSPANTDWFIDPQGADNVENAPALLFPSLGPCMLSANISVTPAAKYDAGALVVYEDPHSWGKFALELSPQGKLTIVSVVTKGTSDDCNAFSATSPGFLRLSKLEQAYAFHFSQDGKFWSLIRYFKLMDFANPRIGFLSQSPTGNGCTVQFTEIHFELRLLADIRSGE